MRRLFLISFLILVTALIVFGYLFLKKSKKPQSLVMDFIPADVELVIECDNLKQFTSKAISKNKVVEELKKNPAIAEFITLLSTIDSICKGSDCEYFLSENHSYFIYDSTSNGAVGLFAFNLKSIKHSDAILTMLNKKIQSVNVIQSNQSKNEFLSITIKKNEPNLYVYNKNGLFLMSRSLNYLEDIIADKNKPKLSSNNLFTVLQENEQSGSDFKIFIKNNQLKDFINQTELKQQITQDSTLWTYVDLNLTDNELKWNGFIDRQKSKLMNALVNQTPVEPTLLNYCPVNTAYFYFLGLNNYSSFSQTFSVENQIEDFKKQRAELNKFTDADIITEWNSIGNGEFMLAERHAEGMIGIVGISNKLKANAFIKQLSDSSFSLSETIIDSVYRIVNPNVFNVLSIGLFNLNASFVFLQNNHLIFADQPDAISKYLNDLKTNGSINSDQNFITNKKTNLSDKCNYFYYQNLSSPNELKSIIKSSFAIEFPALLNNSSSFSDFGFQLSNYKNKIYVQASLNTGKVIQQVPEINVNNTIWELNLDTVSLNTPEIVINHKTQEKEIITSDENGNVYLIDANGNLLWKKTVSGKVISNFNQVDFHRNDKLQYLFNTEDEIHLLNRKGEYIEGFPVKLDEKATNPLSVFDYENDKNYRILIACKNNKIYNYNIEGKKQGGFEVVSTQTTVTNPITFKRVDGKDFLIATDVSGKIYCFDRKGRTRLSFKNNLPANTKSLSILVNASVESTSFVYFDSKKNTLNQLFWTDKLVSKKINSQVISDQIDFSKNCNSKNINPAFLTVNGIDIYDENVNFSKSYANKSKDHNALKTICYKNKIYYLLKLNGSKIKLLDNNLNEIKIDNLNFNQFPVIEPLFINDKINITGAYQNKIMCFEVSLD